jgi:hypothetical protein
MPPASGGRGDSGLRASAPACPRKGAGQSDAKGDEQAEVPGGGGATVLAGGLWAYAPARKARAQAATVTVTNWPYEAKGDGVADDSDAFQNAIDYQWEAGGGAVYVPQRDVYKITRKLYMRDNVTVYGPLDAAGRPVSHIRNYQSSADNYDNGVFCLGNYAGTAQSAEKPDAYGAFDNETFWSFEPATEGSQTLRTTSTNADRFKVGDTIILRSNEEWFNKPGQHVGWTRMELNEVSGVDVGLGRVFTKYPLTERFSTLKVAKSAGNPTVDPNGEPLRVIKNAAVRDLVLSQEHLGKNTAIFPLGGMLNCQIRNIDSPQCNAFASLNGMARSVIDIRGCDVRPVRKAIDISYYSHDSTFYADNLYRLQSDLQDSFMITHGDGAHHCYIEADVVNLGRTKTPQEGDYEQYKATSAVNLGHVRASTVKVGTIAAPDVPNLVDGNQEVRHCTLNFGKLNVTEKQNNGVYLLGDYNEIRVREAPNGQPKDVYIRSGSTGNDSFLGDGVSYVDNSGNSTNTMTRI